MPAIAVCIRFLARLALTGVCIALIAACSTSGRSFRSSALNQIIPGQTTLEQASTILGADPVDVYRQLDGTATARWAQKATLLTDAIYLRQELSLLFGPDGRFERVADSVNVAGHPGVAPAAAASTPAQGIHQSSQRNGQENTLNPLAATSAEPVYKPAAAYPLPQ